jgi:hypothetical protein
MRNVSYKDAKSYAASGKHWGEGESVEKRLKKWFDLYENSFVPILKKLQGCNIAAVKYEEIAKQPDKVRVNLANFIGTDTEGNGHIDTTKMHIVAGNPMRFKGRIEIKYHKRWLKELEPYELEIAKHYESKMQNLMAQFNPPNAG